METKSKQYIRWPPMTGTLDWPVWEGIFITLWKLDPSFVSSIIDKVPPCKSEGSVQRQAIQRLQWLLYFLHSLWRLVELIRKIKTSFRSFSYKLLMHIFPPIITWTRHGLLEIFSCARCRCEGLVQELFRHFGEHQCDKSDPPIIIAFGAPRYSLYLWWLLTKIGTCSRYANHMFYILHYLLFKEYT